MWKVDGTLAYENEAKQLDIANIPVKQQLDISTRFYFNDKFKSKHYSIDLIFSSNMAYFDT